MQGFPFRVNLFVVGAGYSGTTALHFMLNQHPLISMSRVKEPRHFNDLGELKKPVHAVYQDTDVYHGLFEFSEEIQYYGESSVSYASIPMNPSIPGKICDYNKDSKIIYMVRSPFDRLVSSYLDTYRLRREPGTFEEMCGPASSTMFRTDYALQIATYVEQFGRENVKIVISERLRTDPDGELTDILNWLGLENIPSRAEGTDADNHVSPKHVGRPTRLLKALRIRNSPAWRYASRRAPGFVKEAAQRILFEKHITRQDLPLAEVEAKIAPQLIAFVERFEALLGEAVPERQEDVERWPAITGAQPDAL